ncbi:MAG: hypothetical protein ACOYN0_13155 [Phycisphaerales bacterium]
MTLTDLLNHWSLTENPFRGEEARTDEVFARMSGAGGIPPVFHSDFEKFVGDMRRPASSVVFGEKGSGKTSIRLQLARRVQEHNAAHVAAKILLAPYDDLNGVLGRLHDRVGGKTPLESLQKVRLVDHIDSILSLVVPRLIDAILGRSGEEDPIELPADAKKPAKKLDREQRRDLLLLQALYDRTGFAHTRTAMLRRRLSIGFPLRVLAGRWLLYLTPLLIIAAFVWLRWFAPASWSVDLQLLAAWGLAACAVLYAFAALKLGVWDKLRLLRTAIRLRKQLRTIARSDASFARSLAELGYPARDTSELPLTDSDEQRYDMLDRLRRILRVFGYSGIIIVVDRIDEPTLVSGDPERMKAVVWPMLHNKFLQQDSIGVKLLLPIELRHVLFRESSAFFQEARLDKQSLIERLSWTGAMLYDLAEARIAACTVKGAAPTKLMDMFAEDVAPADLVDALDRMKQPRDAFKLLYRCLVEHCAGVTQGQNVWRIPRHTLQLMLRQESERLQQLAQGIRPG